LQALFDRILTIICRRTLILLICHPSSKVSTVTQACHHQKPYTTNVSSLAYTKLLHGMMDSMDESFGEVNDPMNFNVSISMLAVTLPPPPALIGRSVAMHERPDNGPHSCAIIGGLARITH
jgi:hypothetical protein